MPQTMTDPAELLLTSDVARMLGIGNEMVRKLVRTDKLSVAARTPAGYQLFKRSEVERLVEARRINPPRPGPKSGHPKKKTRSVAAKRRSKTKK